MKKSPKEVYAEIEKESAKGIKHIHIPNPTPSDVCKEEINSIKDDVFKPKILRDMKSLEEDAADFAIKSIDNLDAFTEDEKVWLTGIFDKKEYNMICAKFLGLKLGWWIHQEKPLTEDKKQWCDIGGKTLLGSRVYYSDQLMFDSDWNWIMEVMERIECLKGVSVYTGKNKMSKLYSVEIRYEDNSWEAQPHKDKTFFVQHSIKKEAMIKAIWEFLNHVDVTKNVLIIEKENI